MATKKGVLVFAKLWLPTLLLLHKAWALQAEDGWESIISDLAELHGTTF
jgi:hypothetical protein